MGCLCQKDHSFYEKHYDGSAPLYTSYKVKERTKDYIKIKLCDKKPKEEKKHQHIDLIDVRGCIYYNQTSYMTVHKNLEYKNILLSTILNAYENHLDLHLYPDDIQLAINCIVMKYVNQAPESFRHLLVSHQGQKPIEASGVFNTVGKNADSALSKFADLIKNDMKDTRLVDAALCNYSTTTNVELAVSCAQLLDMTKAYYLASIGDGCGIPNLYLHGTTADWEKLKENCEKFSELFSDESIGYFKRYFEDSILPIIDNLIKTSKGKPNVKWWSSMITTYVPFGSSSQPVWDGWLLSLFAQVEHGMEYNAEHWTPKVHIYRTSEPSDTSDTLTNVQIMLESTVATLQAGFLGTHQHPDGSLSTIKGYQVRAAKY